MRSVYWKHKVLGRGVFVALLTVVVVLRLYYPSVNLLLLWLLVWLSSLHVSINLTEGNANRGILSILFSVSFAVVGTKYLFLAEDDVVKEIFSQLLLATGAGAGGNFLAQGVMERDKKNAVLTLGLSYLREKPRRCLNSRLIPVIRKPQIRKNTMKTAIVTVLFGTMFLVAPASFAGNIEPYKAKDIEVYKSKDIEVYKAKDIEVYKAKEIEPAPAKTIKPQNAKQVKTHKTRPVEPVQSSNQVRPFTKEEREKMLQNDRDAGRTRDSMSKGEGAKPVNGQNSIMFKDPYNSGGWNHNTNQSASPIWNPNSQ